MSFWTDAAVRKALGTAARGDAADVVYTDVSTDTRTLETGALFVALDGENFDAHEFLGDAANKGARGAVVERVPDGAPDGVAYYVVGDTLEALGALARYRRRRLNARVAAITGTNGKTTTKEFARAVLETRYRVHATAANLNNLVGAPLTLLEAPEDTEALVVEVGTNAPGEIARLRDIVEADVAIITSIAAGHLEGLGSVEGVLDEKISLLERLPDDGLALVVEEPPELPDRARRLAERVRVAGTEDAADPELRAEEVRIDADGTPVFQWRDVEVRLPLRGRHNIHNALLALGLGEEWGIDADEAATALEGAEVPGMRSRVHRYGDLTVVADCYNANPASTRAALDLLQAMPRGGGYVAVVGSMLELGAESAAMHRQLAEDMRQRDLDLVVATGEFVPAFDPFADAMGERLIRAEDAPDAFDALASRLGGTETILLKGSRGVALERLLPKLEERFTNTPAKGS